MKDIRKIAIYIVIIALTIYGFYILNEKNEHLQNETHQEITKLTSPFLDIYYMDVGEADSTLIRYKDINVLIDGGNTVDGKRLVTYYKSLGVDHFDIVFGTHAHEDHIGGFNFLLRKFPIERFIMPDVPAEWKSYSNMIDALNEKKITLEDPTIDQEIDLGELHFEILWVSHDKEDHNYNSMIIKMTYLDTTYLFTGDATNESEAEILEKDLKSDVLKVAHHGSNHSSSANFLTKVSPKYAIISVGKDNDYGFPKQVTLDKLERLGATIYRTDINHTIRLESDGKNINFDFIDTNTNGGDLGDS